MRSLTSMLDQCRRAFLPAAIMLLAIQPHVAFAEEDYVLKGDLLITTFRAYSDGVYKLCRKIPPEFQYALQNHAGFTLSDDEFVALVGDATGFGIRGVDSLYSRERREIVPWGEVHDIAKTYRSNEYDNYPIVCGISDAARAASITGTDPQDTLETGESQYQKGQAYANGSGVARDAALARQWFAKAAEQDHAAAQVALGLMYQLGSGGPTDFHRAQLLYLKAANQGNADAQANLGGMFWNGDGVVVDHEQSYAWLSLAAKQGQANAVQFIAHVGDRLDAAATRRAQRLASSYADPTTVEEMIAKLSAPDRSLYAQCLVNESDNGETQNNKWCACLSDGFESVLTASDFRLFGQDYPAFRAKLVADPNIDGDWTFTNVLNDCRACKESNYIGCLKEDMEPPSGASFKRVMMQLKDRDFDSIPKNRVYRRFFIEYISAYSNHCRESIKRGKLFTTRLIRRDGLDVSVTDYETLVATGYVASFSNYEWYAEQEYLGELAAATASTETSDAYIENAMGASAVLDEHFQNKCSSDEVRSVYKSLYDFERLEVSQ